ncbi:hypothetical protein [Pseudomonas phage Astolliot]|nr:hypothetical protein [Pseudomonas phage Astolliot]
MSKKSSAFSMEVELRVIKNGGSYATTVLEYADELEIEEDQIPKYISETLKMRLYAEGVNDRTIKDKATGDPQVFSEWV